MKTNITENSPVTSHRVGRPDAALIESINLRLAMTGCPTFGGSSSNGLSGLAGPMFSRTIPAIPGETVERDNFIYADLLPEPRGA